MQEARIMWGSVVRHCRDGVRISAAYCSRDAFYRLAAYFQAFPWVLKVAASTSTSLRLDPAGDMQTCTTTPRLV